MSYNIKAEHKIVLRRADDAFGFFGFPNIEKLNDGRLILSYRAAGIHHLCPFGAAAISYGTPDASKFSIPAIIRNSDLDDRDCAITPLGGERLMATWYTFSKKGYFESPFMNMLYDDNSGWSTNLERYIMIGAHLKAMTPEREERAYGSFIAISEDNGMTWSEPWKCPVASFHGPIKLQDGSLLFCGKHIDEKETGGKNYAYRSNDEGKTWELICELPLLEGMTGKNFTDPCAIQLPNGQIQIYYRYQNRVNTEYGAMSVMMSTSDDNGVTWTEPKPLYVNGLPPHVIRHSSGALVMVYGRRAKPFGISAAVSLDEGKTWITEIILKDDIPHSDLGYPSSVELEDGSIFTVYYQKAVIDGKMDDHASIFGCKWSIDDILAQAKK